jgi:hypothetical protein
MQNSHKVIKQKFYWLSMYIYLLYTWIILLDVKGKARIFFGAASELNGVHNGDVKGCVCWKVWGHCDCKCNRNTYKSCGNVVTGAEDYTVGFGSLV